MAVSHTFTRNTVLVVEPEITRRTVDNRTISIRISLASSTPPMPRSDDKLADVFCLASDRTNIRGEGSHLWTLVKLRQLFFNPPLKRWVVFIVSGHKWTNYRSSFFLTFLVPKQKICSVYLQNSLKLFIDENFWKLLKQIKKTIGKHLQE